MQTKIRMHTDGRVRDALRKKFRVLLLDFELGQVGRNDEAQGARGLSLVIGDILTTTS